MTPVLAYALAWGFFALGHSGLATPWGRRVLERRFGRFARLVYNAVAVVQFALVAWVGTRMPGEAFALPGGVKAAMLALHGAGWVVLLLSARFYDLGRLAGTAQARGASADEGLRRDGPHAYVRHPLYAGGYLILWGAAVNPPGLATAILGSLYLAAGTWLEERKLVALYGEAYADYRRKVPALVPWRGRVAG